MNVYYRLHDILDISLNNVPAGTASFIAGELSMFCLQSLDSPFLRIVFVEKIAVPARCVYLLPDCRCDAGRLYLLTAGGTISFDTAELSGAQFNVTVESTVSPWNVLHIIEKVFSLRCIVKGYSLVHGLCLAEDNGVNLYVGLQGVGKTQLALEKLRKGSAFIAEEYVPVNAAGLACCYPRGMNIHRFMGDAYFRFAGAGRVGRLIVKERLLLTVLASAGALAFFLPPVRAWIDRRIQAKRFIRASVSELFPGTRIVRQAPISALSIMIKTGEGTQVFPAAAWGRRRCTVFIAENNDCEKRNHVLRYFEPFLALRSPESIAFLRYIRGLAAMERRIIASFVNGLFANNSGVRE